MYFSYGIFVDNRVPNFWGEFDSCLNFYTECITPSPLYLLKTQGRSVNAFDNRNRVVYLPLPFAVPRSITGCSCKEYRRSAHRARGLNSTIK